MSIQIHGKEYITVAERLVMAGEALKSVYTEVLQHHPIVVVKAIVETQKGSFTGISSANPAKLIEKTNPYEVAETSAVGRALGFAGYGIDTGIASADEMQKYPENMEETPKTTAAEERTCTFSGCYGHQTLVKGVSKKTNKPYTMWKCDSNDKHIEFVNVVKKWDHKDPYSGETIPVEQYEQNN